MKELLGILNHKAHVIDKIACKYILVGFQLRHAAILSSKILFLLGVHTIIESLDI